MTRDFFADVKAAKEQLAGVSVSELDRAVQNLRYRYVGNVADTAHAELELEGGWTPQLGEWPAGVVARYLTLGDATVDITMSIGPEITDFAATDWRAEGRITAITYTARCQGCNDSHQEQFENVDVYRVQKHHETVSNRGWDSVKPWAQTHADKCRAMPRPDGA